MRPACTASYIQQRTADHVACCAWLCSGCSAAGAAACFALVWSAARCGASSGAWDIQRSAPAWQHAAPVHGFAAAAVKQAGLLCTAAHDSMQSSVHGMQHPRWVQRRWQEQLRRQADLALLVDSICILTDNICIGLGGMHSGTGPPKLVGPKHLTLLVLLCMLLLVGGEAPLAARCGPSCPCSGVVFDGVVAAVWGHRKDPRLPLQSRNVHTKEHLAGVVFDLGHPHGSGLVGCHTYCMQVCNTAWHA
jgi:hypothetical protein